MIAAFVEFGGEKILGKAREISDSLGTRVVAVCSSRLGTDAFCQKLISLGTDEVVKIGDPSNIFEWSEALFSFLESRKQIKFVFAISGPFSDAILGRVYALSRDKVVSFATGIDSISETEASKNLRSWGASMRFKVDFDIGKFAIFTFRPISVPTPFEDDSRLGKVTELIVEFATIDKKSPNTIGLERRDFSDSSSVITFLVDKSLAKEPDQSKLEVIASNYKAIMLKMNSKVQDVYGPCLAVNVCASREKDLPRFHEELISLITSKSQAISRMSDTNFITRNVLTVLENL